LPSDAPAAILKAIAPRHQEIVLRFLRARPGGRASRRAVRLIATALLTSFATMVLAPGSASAAETVTLTGRGWGHGIGMSQWGAKGLAEKGLTGTQILTHYYSGTSLTNKAVPSSIRVGLLQGRMEIQVNGDAIFDIKGSGQKATVQPGQTWRVVPAASGGGKLDVLRPDDTKAFTATSPVSISSGAGARIKLPQTGYRYKRGRIDVEAYDSGGPKTRAVLIAGFEDYLYGLGEVPSSWPVAALRAQAVAGRTYALEKINRLGQNRSGCNCALYSSTADQAYIGYEKEAGTDASRWIDAVNATKGLVVVRGGAPVQAFYASSSGGFTENNENVWGGAALPYLRGVCDHGDYASAANPHSNWSVEVSLATLSQKLKSAGKDVGSAQKITVLAPRGVSGRVRSVIDDTHGGVKVTGSTGSARLSGDQLRSMLGLKSTLIFHRISGGIRNRYDALRCGPGLPKNEEYTWKDLSGTVRGKAQDFVAGRLFWNSSNSKVLWTVGSILKKYDELRKARADFGMPTTDELAATGGRASYFERGRIYWSSATGAHEVHGAILQEYAAAGASPVLGLPTADEAAAGGGRMSVFQKGRIYFDPATGAHIVRGAILDKYLAAGGHGTFGLPKGDEVAVTGGRGQTFSKTRVYWSSGTGAHYVWGGILKKYVDSGGPSLWGLPTTDEIAVPGGRASYFQKGRFYYSSSYGLHEVHGAILAAYLSKGGPGGSLGMPKSDEYAVASGRRTDFAHGSITWDSRTNKTTVKTG
jgi:SpoIID/LytB domain protein